MLKSKKYYFVALSLSFLLFGCSNKQALDPSTVEQPNIQYISHTNEQGNEINQAVDNHFDQVTDLTSITYDDEIIMAVKVDQLSQFNEQKIAKEIESFIENSNSKIKAKVSSDYKIFLEIDRLKDKAINQNLANSDFNKEFEQIKKLIKKPKE
ncbi:YhcN/YlaJ family sporulation lipoprotein [Amphibacillus sp. Q70]|uniref:YhcN/YlaJ family sporulation lipoprotein n=1 Tax=Amphibacillus sp. Q70 TaxID=3453416 RepID=UPI003F84AE78